jgi:hypothetical protein
MKFVFPQSLFQGACSQKVSKKSKNKMRSSNAAQNRFVPRRDNLSFRG